MSSGALAVFAQKLRELRENAGYTMDIFCREYNKKYNGKLNKSTVSRYENAAQEPMISTVRNIADFFAVDTALLMGWETETTAAHMNSIDDTLTGEEEAELREYLKYMRKQAQIKQGRLPAE